MVFMKVQGVRAKSLHLFKNQQLIRTRGGFNFFAALRHNRKKNITQAFQALFTEFYSGTLGTFYRILPRHFRHFLPMHFRHYLHMQFSLQNCEHKNNIIIQLGIIETHAYGSAQFHFSVRSDNIESRNRFLHHNFYSGTLGTIFFKSGTA